MELNYLKQKKDNINALRNSVFALAGVVVVVVIVALGTIIHLSKQKYIVGQTFSASVYASEENPYRRFEVENHVERFIELFWSLDQFTYEDNIEKALYMVGNQGKEIRKQRIAQRYLEKLKQTNVTAITTVDSIKVDMETYPYRVLAHGTQIFTNSRGSTEKKALRLYCTVAETGRGANNIFGLLIDNMKVDIQDIKNKY